MEDGTIVISLAGRDKGKKMAVVGGGDGFVLVADGKERRLYTPKRKNLKHVKATHERIDIMGLTDKALRRLFTSEEKNG
ncbi:MAG: KOW domain-containing RNA-binding protein [Ruminococcus sp.]|jgi:ribosomal protein L14E/L6E/L27E|nr:KOW domain-containing RNA-binding protein [Ruminococcus sp.]